MVLMITKITELKHQEKSKICIEISFSYILFYAFELSFIMENVTQFYISFSNNLSIKFIRIIKLTVDQLEMFI